MNRFKTAFLLTLLTGLLIFIGHYLDLHFKSKSFIFVFFGLTIVMNLVSYWFSDKIILALYGAKKVSESEAPELHRIVSNLAQKAGIPKPAIYMIPTESPNAFATGRSPQHAAVAVTHGIMRILNSDEVECVLGHELSHVSQRDTLIATVVAIIAGMIIMLARILQYSLIFFGGSRNSDRDSGTLGMLFLAIFAPFAAILIQLAISRTREFKADEGGARLTRNPAGLASALQKLEQAVIRMPLNASPTTAHLFIVQPFKGKSILEWFSTHPSTASRIENLRKVGRDIGQIF